MRLIDADAYENEMSKAYGDDWDKLHILESMPSIDAQPVVHGHWINIGIGWYRCSNCNEDNYIGFEPQVRTHKYCINCGAKMDEVTENV